LDFFKSGLNSVSHVPQVQFHFGLHCLMYDIMPNEYVIGMSCFMNITKSETCYCT